MSFRPYITFESLDRNSPLDGATARRIGPLVEFAYRNYSTAISKLRSVNDSNVVAVVRDALQTKTIRDYRLTTRLAPNNVEFIRSFQTEDEVNDDRWITFCKRLENAASKAGLERQFAKALTGTVEEMASNILEHSDYLASGLVGYRWSTFEFEYVVADSGIGVLESLRTNPQYSYLSGHLEALQTALQEGESRHGHNIGRGLGFRDLIKNIANRNSFLRFHSGKPEFDDRWNAVPAGLVSTMLACG